jgi:hypothetical protein
MMCLKRGVRYMSITLMLVFLFVSGTLLAQDAKELKSDHFIIMYTNESNDSVYKVKDDAEYLFRKITDEFGVMRTTLWTWDNRTRIHIAKDRNDYTSRFNCPSWSAACVDSYNRLIYTYPNQERFSVILAHELTHIIFREYIGYNRLPLWLDEGMASFMEYKDTYQASGIMAYTKEIIKQGGYIPFAQINTMYSLSGFTDTSLFYNQSFSMVYFLIKRFSREDYGTFLSYLKQGNSLEDSLRKAFPLITDMKNFEEAWKKFYSM